MTLLRERLYAVGLEATRSGAGVGCRAGIVVVGCSPIEPTFPPTKGSMVVEPPLPARSVLLKEIDEFAAEVRELEVWLDGVADLLNINDP